MTENTYKQCKHIFPASMFATWEHMCVCVICGVCVWVGVGVGVGGCGCGCVCVCVCARQGCSVRGSIKSLSSQTFTHLNEP